MFPVLNLPIPELRLSESKTGRQVFDIIRKKFVPLTPEEWVRQHWIHFLINEKKVPLPLIAVEKMIKVHNTSKRVDLLVYKNDFQPILMIELKSQLIRLEQAELNQLMRYNISVKSSYCLLSNGLEHIILDCRSLSCRILDHLPDYPQLIENL